MYIEWRRAGMRFPLFEWHKNKSGRVAVSTKTSGSTEVLAHLKMNNTILVYEYKIMPFLLIDYLNICQRVNVVKSIHKTISHNVTICQGKIQIMDYVAPNVSHYISFTAKLQYVRRLQTGISWLLLQRGFSWEPCPSPLVNNVMSGGSPRPKKPLSLWTKYDPQTVKNRSG